jgi:alpha,alpha-trehalase
MQTPEPTVFPQPLPVGLLPDLLQSGDLLLCLDYDGTLSEITSQPDGARPVPGVVDSLLLLAQYTSRIEVAIVSGRDLGTLRQFLGLQCTTWLIGTHGLEMIDREGQRLHAPGVLNCTEELQCVRRWIDKEHFARSGFVIEDKELAIALHYRLVEPFVAASVQKVLRQLVERECPGLRIIQGKMVNEIVPKDIGGKGYAVRWLLSSMPKKPLSIVYFGDDTTDEDAFFELCDKGVTVLVGPCRRSWARYFTPGPSAVAGILRELANMVHTSPP